MDNLNNMYYLLQIVIQQIFVFLRDLVVHEFPKLLVSSNVSSEAADEMGQLKNRTSSIKHNFVDFAVCFILCSFVGVLIFLSIRGSKEEVDDDFTDKPTTERIVMDLPEDPIYHFPKNWRSQATKYYRNRGDEYFSEENESPRKETSCKKKYKSRNNSNSKRIESVKNGMSRQLWMIRKTRSGHIYGKYPI